MSPMFNKECLLESVRVCERRHDFRGERHEGASEPSLRPIRGNEIGKPWCSAIRITIRS